jgi:hypothetical protein
MYPEYSAGVLVCFLAGQVKSSFCNRAFCRLKMQRTQFGTGEDFSASDVPIQRQLKYWRRNGESTHLWDKSDTPFYTLRHLGLLLLLTAGRSCVLFML